MSYKEILVNAIKTPDGTYLESRHRWDYKEHLDKVSGEVYMVDGGTFYLRCSVNKVKATDMCVYTDDPHKLIRKWFSWGTNGPNGDRPTKYVLLKALTTPHIINILNYCRPMSPKFVKVFLDELAYRVVVGLESPKEGSY